MTIQESITSEVARGAKVVEGFSKAFRIDELGNIEVGESFVIPDNYQVLSKPMMRDGKPVMYNGEPVTAEFIKVQTNTGRICNFYPTSLTKVAFRVDPETGKDVIGADRIVRTQGNLVTYVKDHPDINVTMKKLIGCTVKLEAVTPVTVRNFGVSNEKATKESIARNPNNIGTWLLIGEKKPEDWPAGL